MKWSLRIGRLAGVSVFVHVTFLLLPLWVGLTQYRVRESWADAVLGVVFILLLFGIVVLHELGHAVTARRFGIKTRDITLLPIGGVARLERLPENPREELLVALAGPAVNVGVAALCFAMAGAQSEFSRITEISIPQGELLGALMWVNVALAVFNLLPAFPMDGGRVLRALLALRMEYVRATNLAAGIGQVLALVFGFVGLASIFFGHLGPISNPFLLLIALFVWVGASQEAGLVRMKSALGDVPVSDLMIREFHTLSPHQPLSSAAGHLLGGWQRDFPVLEQSRVVGMLSSGALVHGLAQHGQDALVGEIMRRQLPAVDPAESAERALVRLRTGEEKALLVLEGDQLKGILTQENVHEFLLIRAALKGGDLRVALAETQRKAA